MSRAGNSESETVAAVENTNSTIDFRPGDDFSPWIDNALNTLDLLQSGKQSGIFDAPAVSSNELPPFALTNESKVQESNDIVPTANKSDFAASEKSLHDAIGTVDPVLAKQFVEYSSRFKERATKQGLSEEEQLNTYKALEELISAPDGPDSKLGKQTRVLMAFDFVFHAADPSTIDQGEHGTCGPTVIEARMMAKYPARVADMIKQVSLTGIWTAPDGKVIEVDDRSLWPGEEEQYHPPLDGKRSLASQIFQVTSLNDLGQRGELSQFNGKIVSYCQGDIDPNSAVPSIARFGDYVKGEGEEQIGDFRGLDPGTTQKELSRLTGETTPHVIVHTEKDKGRNEGVIHINSQEQLLDDLLKLKGKTPAENDLPAIVSVNAYMPPFNRPNKGGTVEGHIVSITDIRQSDDGAWQVFLDNEWGKETTESAQDGWISLAQIYEATRPLQAQPA